jgi:hypothetical protein
VKTSASKIRISRSPLKHKPSSQKKKGFEEDAFKMLVKVGVLLSYFFFQFLTPFPLLETERLFRIVTPSSDR